MLSDRRFSRCLRFLRGRPAIAGSTTSTWLISSLPAQTTSNGRPGIKAVEALQTRHAQFLFNVVAMITLCDVRVPHHLLCLAGG